jgi:hypothetical protein
MLMLLAFHCAAYEEIQHIGQHQLQMSHQLHHDSHLAPLQTGVLRVMISALKSGPVPVFTLLEGRLGPGPVLLFQILYKNQTGPYRTGLYWFMLV